jgi:hypothetical protein
MAGNWRGRSFALMVVMATSMRWVVSFRIPQFAGSLNQFLALNTRACRLGQDSVRGICGRDVTIMGSCSCIANACLGPNFRSRSALAVLFVTLTADGNQLAPKLAPGRVGLGHNTFTRPAIDLMVRSADGVLRKAATSASAA